MTNGDWSDTKPLNRHDSAKFEVELVEKIEQLTSELNHLKTLCWNVCYGEDMWGAIDKLKQEIGE